MEDIHIITNKGTVNVIEESYPIKYIKIPWQILYMDYLTSTLSAAKEW